MEDDLPDEDGNKKQKRPRKPRRSQLEDAYPPAIQVTVTQSKVRAFRSTFISLKFLGGLFRHATC